MSSAQERIQRLPLDKWSKREQLCLASAVSCSGDQNWITVSRSVKAVCSNDKRPTDWYSQKNCAVQYGHMLETVESTKRKKRDSGTSSPAPVETPTELLLKRLTEERIAEIQTEMQRDQEEYAILYKEVKAIQSGELSETDLRDMWRKAQKEQEEQRINEMKLENRLREREQRKQEMINSWRSAPSKRTTTNADTTAVDMDVEEIQSVNSKPNTPLPQQQPATSPLLSSLLKSPTPTNTPVNIQPNGSLARTTAPTITSLLTSGALPNQPAITIKSNIPASETAFITRPISGPPALEANLPTTPTGKSPSQSAPTLSMLLEKTKVTGSPAIVTTSSTSQSSGRQSASKVAETDTNNEQVPMDIEDSHVSTPAVNNGSTKTVIADSDETDPNEEQQLLEVFKNIGNIDDIDIDMTDVIDDEEVSFLADVHANSSNEVKEVIDFEDKLDALKREENNAAAPNKAKTVAKAVNEETSDNAPKPKSDETPVELPSSDDSNDNIPLAEVASLESKERSQSTTEFIVVQDDTESTNLLNDKKDELTESGTSSNTDDIRVATSKAQNENDQSELSSCCRLLANENSVGGISTQSTEGVKDISSALIVGGDSCDVILIATDDDETIFEKPASTVQCDTYKPPSMEQKAEESINQGTPEIEVNVEEKGEEAIEGEIKHTDNSLHDVAKVTSEGIKDGEIRVVSTPQPTIISILDTDEDSSSMTDASKDEISGNKSSTQPTTKKSSSASSETEVKSETIEKNTTAIQPTSTAPITSTSNAPARSTLLRKLRDRDRSESPMIEDESNTTISDHVTKFGYSRRRYSSTPVIDSIPSSPASSEHTDDRRETRGASKKIFLSIYSTLHDSKHATIFRKPFYDEHPQKFADLCNRPLDLPTIKKNIDSGIIRSIVELQRDMLIMVQHVLILYRPSTTQHKTAIAFLQDCHAIKEFVAIDKCQPANLNTAKARSGSRKSQRLI